MVVFTSFRIKKKFLLLFLHRGMATVIFRLPLRSIRAERYPINNPTTHKKTVSGIAGKHFKFFYLLIFVPIFFFFFRSVLTRIPFWTKAFPFSKKKSGHWIIRPRHLMGGNRKLSLVLSISAQHKRVDFHFACWKSCLATSRCRWIND